MFTRPYFRRRDPDTCLSRVVLLTRRMTVTDFAFPAVSPPDTSDHILDKNSHGLASNQTVHGETRHRLPGPGDYDGEQKTFSFSERRTACQTFHLNAIFRSAVQGSVWYFNDQAIAALRWRWKNNVAVFREVLLKTHKPVVYS